MMAANAKGFAPACLNFSKLVSAPRAVMAIVSRKVSKEFIAAVHCDNASAGINDAEISHEFNPITAKNQKANQGMAILLLPSL